MLIIATLVLAGLTHNIVRYAILQKRFASFFIMSFYVLAGLVLLTDIIWHCFQIYGANMINEVGQYLNSTDEATKIVEVTWLVGRVHCMLNARDEGHPIESCKPASGDPEWQNTIFWFVIKGWRVFIATCYLYYIELFFYVSIGSVQISSMGDLAIQL